MRELLKNPLYKKLAIVQFLIYFGSFFSTVAIYTLVVELNATPIQIAVTSVAFLIPSLFGFVSGAVVDKYLSKKFMATTLFLEALFSSFILFISSLEQFYFLIFLIIIRATCSFVFFASQMALFPYLSSNEVELKNLNTLHSMIWSINFALGMSLGGLVVNLIGVKGAIIIDVLLFLLAFFIFLQIDFKKISTNKETISKLIKDGLIYLKNSSLTLKLIFLHASIALTNFDTIINLLAKYKYASFIAISLTIGFLNATRALALLVGAAFLNRYLSKENLEYFLFFQGFAIIVWSLLEKSFWGSLVSMLFVGIFTTILWSYTYTLMQLSIKKEYLGRVVAYSDTIFMLLSMSVSFLSGYLYEKGFSIEAITALLGLGFFLFAFYYRVVLKKELIFHH
jgi:MFS family permease